MDFSTALRELKGGRPIRRSGWNGKGMSLHLQVPDTNSNMTLPYIYLEYGAETNPSVHAGGSRVPYLASQTDILAEDWEHA